MTYDQISHTSFCKPFFVVKRKRLQMTQLSSKLGIKNLTQEMILHFLIKFVFFGKEFVAFLSQQNKTLINLAINTKIGTIFQPQKWLMDTVKVIIISQQHW